MAPRPTHVRIIQTVDLATGRGVQRREYGYWRQRDDDPAADWVTTHIGPGVDLSLSVSQIETWAEVDRVTE